MSDYRSTLYRHYSATFGGQKSYDPAVQHAQYAATYPNLPAAKDALICDLGCGKGEWLTWLAGKGYTKLCGVDGSVSDLRIAEQNGPKDIWVEANVISFMFAEEKGSVDLLHSKDVIEHLSKDEVIQFLEAAYGLLKTGGQLWLLTFNAQSPLSAATRYGDFTHESAFTPSSLAQCMRVAGFLTVEIQGRHYCSNSPGGRLRKIIGALFYRAARFVLKLRHGAIRGEDAAFIDYHATQPDLFAVGIKD